MSQYKQFEIRDGYFGIASAHGMAIDDQLVLWRKACDEKNCPGDGTDLWILFRPEGCQRAITSTLNPLKVDWPGVYQLRFAGIVNPEVEVCVSEFKACC